MSVTSQCAGVALILLGSSGVRAGDAPAPELERRFGGTVQPFVQAYCIGCHSAEKAKGDLDLSPYTSAGKVAGDFARWELVRERLEAGEMPPAKAERQPSAGERARVVEWIGALRADEARRHAGDPGPVFARRLSGAEYDYTIRDLTGFDIRPAKQFPVDPANQAGFDNSSESLAMTPSLLKKYLEAARVVADHLVLKPDGLEFAPHPVVADTDRDKFCVNRIIAFYKRQDTDLSHYFFAAWQHAHAKKWESIEQVAAEAGVSATYLKTIVETLEGEAGEMGPIAALRAWWRSLPAEDATAARARCVQMREFVEAVRQPLVPVVENLTSPKVHPGSQALVLWKDRQMAANRRRYAGGARSLPGGLLPGTAPEAAVRAMAVPADAARAEAWEKTFEEFCSIFPDAFVVSERARVYLDPAKEKKLTGRLLSAGFHSQMGYFRDDGPMYELMLDEGQRKELDRLWFELDFVASAPFRQYSGFLWFDRTDSNFLNEPRFEFARAEDKDCTSAAKMARLEHEYLDKAVELGAGETAQQAIKDYFEGMSATIRRIEKARVDAEPTHLRDLVRIAERAYRRPLNEAERKGVGDFYKSLRAGENLTHEEAVRDTLVSILMSPHFCYRLDLPRGGGGEASAVKPLDDYALASRLSYFLWSSMPDEELMRLAAAGRLHEPEVLTAQVRRMVRDERVTAFATEFAGQWLDFRRFEEHNGVDRERFPAFTNQLREAMFEEPVRFVADLVRRDGSALDLLYGDYTFVNPVLAQFYGVEMKAPAATPVAVAEGDGEGVVPTATLPEGPWVRVEKAHAFGRGGIFPMAVFLSANSPGLRTSPVKRGNWVVKRVLGEHIPPPPAKVPELPSDEAKLGELTLRQTLERHRADPTCAACHARFDSFGLVFEGYGPVGERREKDLGGRAVDASAEFPDHSAGAGLEGLRKYIRERRQGDFVDNLCRRVLAYGLGRTLMPSDDQTVGEMKAALVADGYRVDRMIERVVLSPQFKNKRSGESAEPQAANAPPP